MYRAMQLLSLLLLCIEIYLIPFKKQSFVIKVYISLLYYLLIQCWYRTNGNLHSTWRLVRTWSGNRICRYYGVCSNDEKRSNEYDSNQSKFRYKTYITCIWNYISDCFCSAS